MPKPEHFTLRVVSLKANDALESQVTICPTEWGAVVEWSKALQVGKINENQKSQVRSQLGQSLKKEYPN